MSTSFDRAQPPLPDLRVATPRQWALAQRAYVDELLVEQAHLEKKAAASAMQFLFRVPAPTEALRGLSALAREELVHFERTLKLLAQRGVAYGPLEPCSYASRLKAAAATTMPERLVDELLIAAVIEARSHERLHLLAEAFADTVPDVAAFYADLAAAEERHADVYVELAAAVVSRSQVAERHRRMLDHEACVLRELAFAPRLHSGFCGMAGLGDG